ncbi:MULTISPECIES: ComEA family DNA-binding protein [Aeromonas]|jgi:competence protein ComEA|uniref:ComEA protein n=1 Tax=Aeromonas hydrophila subsp. hydrophila (strain ATCC 7966 / DSM 30187 / BCRC 13018 / CCUG 14551 / JCM 1027 / KCTC 2358 / NCIMB 9240 / NCTC 8049) TaxID=380703 RepID=A0KNX1_AERHH|nr:MULTISPECIES: ComEA family DNA-binding protein [Aeromonas]ABK37240.1 ComEA protein [Aeromonas hydrophila subsp. hydrophila ATCC 7966]AGM45476.1 ComEA protein [Aeromonas hydrophila ML09-119]AHX34095.1 competence protein ComEA [Aeromonas hydrophila subsp. hydrophila AL09-71]AHX70896.1 competence protein ComEA [Aeromonas hydrophila pc104A]AJE35124.1 competence protein ComEA [Aeromonas hydrophila J-1]
MNYKTLTATLLLSCLPLLSQPLLAADKPAAKPATTVTAAKESGKVNLNTASINELTALKGIGEKKAQAIVDYREKQGKFTTVDQLADVSGIGPATLEANRDMIIVK